MAVIIHEEMPCLEQIVLLDNYVGDMRDLRDPTKTRVRLTEVSEREQQELSGGFGDVGEFQEFYEDEDWICPELKWIGWVLNEKESKGL